MHYTLKVVSLDLPLLLPLYRVFAGIRRFTHVHLSDKFKVITR